MRFQLGPIPVNPAFDPQVGGWQKIREPPFPLFLLMSLPVAAFVLVGCLLVLTAIPDPSAKIVLKPGSVTFAGVALSFLCAVGGLAALVVVHEAIHVAGHPGMGRSKETVVGVWPSRFIAYAHFDGVIGRNRFLLMIALPVLLLTAAPLLAFLATQRVHIWIALVAVVNGISSCFDLLVLLIVLAQVPNGAVLRNSGWDTYWRVPDEGHEERTAAREDPASGVAG